MTQHIHFKLANGRRPRGILQARAIVALACTFLAAGATALTLQDPLSGRWRLDARSSTNPADELKGIREKKRYRRSDTSGARATGPGSATANRYWREANAGKEWKHSKELAHAGPLQRLLESNNLEIIRDEAGYLFVYADGFERHVRPNAEGRVFTASGDELVETDIGFTLAYWDKAVLVLETRIRGGGKLLERVATSPNGDRLTVKIEIDRRDWKWVAKLERVYDRAVVRP